MSDDFSDDEEFLESIRRHEQQATQPQPQATQPRTTQPLQNATTPVVTRKDKPNDFSSFPRPMQYQSQQFNRQTPDLQTPDRQTPGFHQQIPQTFTQAQAQRQPMSSTNSQADLNYTQLPPEVRNKLYQADGEIAILRDQLNQAKMNNHQETMKLRNNFSQSKDSMDEQVKMLRFTIEKLEDEKKFLDNQLRSSYPKRRKIDDNDNKRDNGVKSTGLVEARVIRVQNDVSLLTEFIWKLSINGSDRTIMEYLSKISINDTIIIDEYQIKGKVPLSSIILEYLILKKDLRLDILLDKFSGILCSLINQLIDINLITSVPFLLALVHGILEFKPLAITQSVILNLTKVVMKIINVYKYQLNNDDQEFFNYNKNQQQLLLEKFLVICGMDILERLMILCSNKKQLQEELFYKYGIENLISQLLPRNSEALVGICQINVLYNIVEILNSFYEPNNYEDEEQPEEDEDEDEDEEKIRSRNKNRKLSPMICQTLIKISLLEIPIKEDFQFYGLNRCIGNNNDFKKIDSLIPEIVNELGEPIITLPNPIQFEFRPNKSLIQDYPLKYNHEFHYLQLRLTINGMIENYLINTLDTKILKDKETVKLTIRVINFEQQFITRSPRSKLIRLRIEIISSLIRILNYLFNYEKSQLNEVFNPTTLNELSIVLLKIAFISETSLNNMGNELISTLRHKGYKQGIFNECCESMARQLSNINDQTDNKSIIAEVESEYPNGLEFPYDSETVELAREILSYCADPQVADNLYINMNGYETREYQQGVDQGFDEEFDEMDIVV